MKNVKHSPIHWLQNEIAFWQEKEWITKENAQALLSHYVTPKQIKKQSIKLLIKLCGFIVILSGLLMGILMFWGQSSSLGRAIIVCITIGASIVYGLYFIAKSIYPKRFK